MQFHLLAVIALNLLNKNPESLVKRTERKLNGAILEKTKLNELTKLNSRNILNCANAF